MTYYPGISTDKISYVNPQDITKFQKSHYLEISNRGIKSLG